MPVLLAVGAVLAGLDIRARIPGICTRLNSIFGSSSRYQSHDTLRGMRKRAIDQSSQCLGFGRDGRVRHRTSEPGDSIVQVVFGLAIVIKGIMDLVILFTVCLID